MKIFSKFLATAMLIVSVIACDEGSNDPGIVADAVFIDKTASTHMLEVTSTADGTALPVYVAFPADRAAPLKAVLVLHGSGGPWDDDDLNGDGIAEVCNVGTPSAQTRDWRDLLTSNGFMAIFVDSYSPRGTCENEGDYKNPPLKFDISGTFVRNRDAYDVLALVRKLHWQDEKTVVFDGVNIAVVGFSDGGTSVISTLFDTNATPTGWTWKQSFSGTTYTSQVKPPAQLPEEGGFKVGVMYYPGAYHNGYYGRLCDNEGIYRSYCDVLVHLALDDPLTDNARCLIETMGQNGGGAATVYEYDADHGFDGNGLACSNDARTRTLAFLKARLK